jgi:hypothetical protein
VVSGQLQAPAALPPGKEPASTHCIGDLVGPIAGLDAAEQKFFFCPCRESNPGPLFHSPSLHRQKSEVYRRKVDTWDEMLDRIMNATAHTKECEYERRLATCHVPTRVALMLKVEFSKMYYKLTNLSIEQ